MRISRVLMVCCVSILVEAPAIAQQAPTRTVDDYVCAFAGDCAQQKPATDDSIAGPKSRGFRLSVPEKKGAQDARQSPAATPGLTASPANVGTPARRPAATRVANRRPAPAAKAAVQERRMDLRLSFMLGSAELTNQAREEAKVFASALLRPELADKRFLIEGHTDSSGTRALNLDLSRRRAAAVADYLSTLGVKSDRLDIRGYGPDRPIPGRRAISPANRRVEAKLL